MSALLAQRHLSKHFSVTLIDFKDYFEYTPGILRAFVKPNSLCSSLTCPLPRNNNSLLLGEVTGVTPENVEVKQSDGTVKNVTFDYLLVGSGSSYSGPIKPSPNEPTVADRSRTWDAEAARLRKAQTVLIIGGGPVGVELAAEIVATQPEKRIMIVDAQQKLCAAFPSGAITHMTNWLQQHNVELVLGEFIDSLDEQGCVLQSGRRLEADIVYRCMGFQPNSAFLSEDFKEQISLRGALKVTDTMQVAGCRTIFGMGDVSLHEKTNELKLGHTAELNAHLAAENVHRLHTKQQLLCYPHGVVGSAVSPKVYCISLGEHDGILIFNSIVLYGAVGGFLAAVMKWLLEWTKVAASGERPVGVLFWAIADSMSALISKYVLPQPDESMKDRAVVLFDGECNLCDGFVNFVIANDPNNIFQFAPIQSEMGATMMQQGGLKKGDLSSMVLIDEYGYHRQSTAALRVLRKLQRPWPLLYMFILLPPPLRNLGYKLVARFRYVLFGKRGKCDEFPEAMMKRFLVETKDS